MGDNEKKEKQFEGAMVFTPIPDVYDNVALIDFKS